MIRRVGTVVLATAAVMTVSAASALAQPDRDAPPPETRRTVAKPKRMYFRAGALHMIPNAKSEEVVITGVSGTASLAVMDGPVAGSSTDIASLTVPAMIVGYRWPTAGGEFAVETILAQPVTLELRAGGTLADESLAPTVLDDIPTGIPALGQELGTTKAVPPTVTAVYRRALGAHFHPYVGAGASYLFTYGSEITNPVLTEVSPPALHIENGWSAVAQAGLDVRLGRLAVTFDVKYMTGFHIRGTLTDIYVRSAAFPLYDAVHVGDATLDVKASPLIFQAGAGMDF